MGSENDRVPEDVPPHFGSLLSCSDLLAAAGLGNGFSFLGTSAEVQKHKCYVSGRNATDSLGLVQRYGPNLGQFLPCLGA